MSIVCYNKIDYVFRTQAKLLNTDEAISCVEKEKTCVQRKEGLISLFRKIGTEHGLPVLQKLVSQVFRLAIHNRPWIFRQRSVVVVESILVNKFAAHVFFLENFANKVA